MLPPGSGQAGNHRVVWRGSARSAYGAVVGASSMAP
jgi:hypothetical protein